MTGFGIFPAAHRFIPKNFVAAMKPGECGISTVCGDKPVHIFGDRCTKGAAMLAFRGSGKMPTWPAMASRADDQEHARLTLAACGIEPGEKWDRLRAGQMAALLGTLAALRPQIGRDVTVKDFFEHLCRTARSG